MAVIVMLAVSVASTVGIYFRSAVCKVLLIVTRSIIQSSVLCAGALHISDTYLYIFPWMYSSNASPCYLSFDCLIQHRLPDMMLT